MGGRSAQYFSPAAARNAWAVRPLGDSRAERDRGGARLPPGRRAAPRRISPFRGQRPAQRRSLGHYFNQPRLRKYTMGTAADNTIKTSANG
jgi:hypothetical protein